ncbi:MAG: hypothetical protein WA924_11340 [Burkholderiaceae bacterium]
MSEHDPDNPMHHPDEQPTTGSEGTPRFGRLLIVLALVVVLIGIITYVSEAMYS